MSDEKGREDLYYEDPITWVMSDSISRSKREVIEKWGEVAQKHSQGRDFSFSNHDFDGIREDAQEFIENPSEGNFEDFWDRLHSAKRSGSYSEIYSKWIEGGRTEDELADLIEEILNADEYDEGWEDELGARRTLRELFGFLHISDYPMINSSVESGLEFFGYDTPSSYLDAVEEFESFKQLYKDVVGQVTEETDHEVPVNYEIDQLFNIIDKSDEDSPNQANKPDVAELHRLVVSEKNGEEIDLEERTFWNFVSNKENWRVCLENKKGGLSRGSQNDSWWEEISVGDALFFYCKQPVSGIIGLGVVESKDEKKADTPLWSDEEEQGEVLYPHRFDMDILYVLEEENWESDAISISDLQIRDQGGIVPIRNQEAVEEVLSRINEGWDIRIRDDLRIEESPDPSPFSDGGYYWVNQSRDVEVEEEFLRASVDNEPSHNLTVLNKGDIVFHHKNKTLIGYSEVVSDVRTEEIDGEKYYFVDVDFNEYDEKPSIDQVNGYLSGDRVRVDPYYPLDSSGRVNQGYLFRLSHDGGEWLLNEGWRSNIDWREQLEVLPDSVEIEPTDLHFPQMEEQILGQVSKALENGDHVLLVGPPGTGKSKLARTICESVVDDDYEFVTGTSDWSTFDTVGGYHPEKDESLVFKPGVFLNRFKNEQGNPQNEWLVIDEINRADIDKAFGALFSVLAGDNVTLSFTDESDQSIRVVCNGDPEQGTPNNVYYVPDDWRMVATMNTLDKTSLYEMSYAFMRRWAFVSVPVPEIPTDNDEAAELIADYVDVWRENGGDEERYPEIAELWRIVNKYREIGPAIVEDIYDHVENDPDPDYASAISMYIIPQMEGLRENQLNEFVEDLEGTEADADRVRNFAKDYFQADI